jgi:hypothetical protein
VAPFFFYLYLKNIQIQKMAKFLPASAPGMNDPALYLAAVDFSEKRIELWEQQVTPSRASVRRACLCVCVWECG